MATKPEMYSTVEEYITKEQQTIENNTVNPNTGTRYRGK